MNVYAEALAAGEPAPPVGLRQIRSGTINALAVSYFNSRDFRKLAPSSQSAYRGIIDRLCKQDGDKPVAGLQRWHIVNMMNLRSDQPEAANALLTMLRVLMKHGVDTGLRQDNPARDVQRARSKSDGHHSWTEEEIGQFEATHPIGSRARLAFALLLYTGQRRSDVVKMGRQHIRDGWLHVKQAKTGAKVDTHVAYATTATDHRGEFNRSDDLRRNSVRQTVPLEQFQQLVPFGVRCSRIAPLFGAWACVMRRRVGSRKLDALRTRSRRSPVTPALRRSCGTRRLRTNAD